MIGLIPRPMHGVLDYLWSIVVFFAPELFGFQKDKAATMYFKVRAGSAIVASLMTRYELGLIKIIPFNLHLLLDFAGAVFGFFAPQLLGFNKNEKARQANLLFSGTELGAVMLSKRDGK